MPFYRGRLFPLTFLSGLLVEFTPPELGEDTRLLTGTLEAPQGGIKILILANTNAGHSNLKWLARPPGFGDRGAHSKVRPGKRQRPRQRVGLMAHPRASRGIMGITGGYARHRH